MEKQKVCPESTRKKSKGGRPRKYNTIDLKKVVELAANGMTEEEMAQYYGICRRTFFEYQKKQEFLHTLKKNKALADYNVEKALYHRAIGYEHVEEKIFQYEGKIVRTTTIKHIPPDATSMIFWLKNRKPAEWRDKHELEIKDYLHKELKDIPSPVLTRLLAGMKEPSAN